MQLFRTKRECLRETRSSSQTRPIAIDLFAGAGGLSLGLEQAGFDVVAAVEIDPIHCATHEYNFPNCETICGDVSEMSGAAVRKWSRIGNRSIDVVCGGAPCQGFSLMGKRALDDPRNRLAFHFMRLVQELNPKYFVFENVKGLTVGAHKGFLDELIEGFQATGYNVLQPYKVLNAANYGVPQLRQRLFLLGARKGLPLPEYPNLKTVVGGLKNNGHSLLATPTVWQAIGDLPDVEQFEALLGGDCVNTKLGRASSYAKVLRGLEPDGENFGYRREFSRTLLSCSGRSHHNPESRKRFTAAGWGETEPVSRFFKLHPDGQCNTLRAGTASDRGAFTSPRPIHPHVARCITVREAARLHSYPDWFRFHGTKWHGFRQIGNSVPPFLGRAVAGEVLRTLGCEPMVPEQKLELGDESLLRFSMSQACDYFGVPHNVIKQRIRKT
jgi:DNA (cytosine-5)-methyltransferase 1